MKSIKTFLVISIIVNLILGGGVIYRYYVSSSSKGTEDRQRIIDSKTRLFNSLKVDSSDIVFLGNSLTEGFPISEMMANSSIKNRGISGNTNKEIRDRLKPIIDGKPSKVIIMSGINDLKKPDVEIDSVFFMATKIIDAFQKNSAGTILYFQSVLPVDEGRYPGTNARIVKYNTMLQNYCNRHNVRYIDLHKSFVKGAVMNESYTTDGLHLSAEGYFLWYTIVKDIL